MNDSLFLPAIFLEYQNPGFHLPLFIPALTLALPSTIGIILNSSVCYITWKYWGKYTTFKCKTSILIAINSLLEIFHQSGHFVFFFITLTGINFIPVSLAFKIQGHSIVAADIVNIIFFTMSVDRVIAVAFPIFKRKFSEVFSDFSKYRKSPKYSLFKKVINKFILPILITFIQKNFYNFYSYANLNFRFYIFLHILPNFIFSIFILYLILSTIGANPNYPVTGNLADIYGLSTAFDVRLVFVPLLLISILLHIIVGFLVKYKGDLANEKVRKLFRSLTLIIFVNIGGYFFFNLIIGLVIGFITMSPVMIWYLSGYLAIILNISAAVNAPILYFNSIDYNTAYKKEFGIIKTKFLATLKINILDNSVTVYQ